VLVGAHRVSHAPQPREVVALVERHAVVIAESLTGSDLFLDLALERLRRHRVLTSSLPCLRRAYRWTHPGRRTGRRESVVHCRRRAGCVAWTALSTVSDHDGRCSPEDRAAAG